MTDTERENIKKICRRFLSNKLQFLSEEDENWIFEYLASGKGMIPYQMITDFNSFEIMPKDEFFDYDDFYSCLKEKNITKEEYKNVKKLFKVLKLRTLGDLNQIYNFQDTAILHEIFEQRSACLQELFKFNPKKCNTASSFSGCVQRLKSKCCIALPTNAEVIRVFEKTVMRGYSCINTRMTFDTEIFLKDPKNEKLFLKLKMDNSNDSHPDSIKWMRTISMVWQ